jgi:putative ABC transport system ATP-binding protein
LVLLPGVRGAEEVVPGTKLLVVLRGPTLMLEVVHVSKTYPGRNGQVTALADVSLTTLLLTVGGLLHPDAGQVKLNGREVYALGQEERARFRAANIGFVFQQFHLVPYLSVLDNVLSAALAVPLPDARQRAERLVEDVGLSARRHHVPAQLSTGERQRTALARALLQRPPLLLADEPTGNLDPDNGAVVLNCLANHARAGGAVLLATHDAEAAARAGRVLLFDRPGRLKEAP